MVAGGCPENGVDEVHMHAISSRQLPGQYLDVVSTGRGLLLPFPCPPFTHMAAGTALATPYLVVLNRSHTNIILWGEQPSHRLRSPELWP